MVSQGSSGTAVGAQEWAGLLGQLRCLDGRSYAVQQLGGGLTNVNLRVTGTGPDPLDVLDVVVRIAQPGTELLAIDRRAEHLNSRAAHAAGVGAPVVEFLPEAGLLVVGYVEGRTLSEDDLRRGDLLPRVATACRTLHAGPRFANTFDMFSVQRDYLRIVAERGFRLPEGYLAHMDALGRVEAAIAARPVTTVPCHNDLLAANLLDDGTRLWLIDYEYSGNNDPWFELGNLWAEAQLSLEQLEELVTCYAGRPPPGAVARARLWGLMASYGWTLWASIQDAVSTLDHDFWSWGLEKYDRAVGEFRSPDFDRLLAEVAQDAADD